MALEDHRGRRRVVVTGMGVISPVGQTTEEAWRAVTAGESGIGPITLFDTTGYDVKIAGEVKEFDADVPFGEPSIRPLRFVSAGDILGTIVRAITEPGQKSEGDSSGGGTSGTNRNTGTSTSRPR